MFFEVDVWGDPVGVGVTGSRYCTLGAVAKSAGPQSELAATNEFICGRLGLILGLPVPPGVLVGSPSGEAAYVALRFGRRGEQPPPVIAQDLVDDQPSLAAGIVAFDYWVANQDRNPGNVAYAREGNIPVAAFDHERALLGPSRGGAAERLVTAARANFAVGGCLAPLIRDGTYLVEWAQRIERLPPEAITAVCFQTERVGVLDGMLARQAADFLIARRSLVLGMLRTTMTGVTTWGLL